MKKILIPMLMIIIIVGIGFVSPLIINSNAGNVSSIVKNLVLKNETIANKINTISENEKKDEFDKQIYIEEKSEKENSIKEEQKIDSSINVNNSYDNNINDDNSDVIINNDENNIIDNNQNVIDSSDNDSNINNNQDIGDLSSSFEIPITVDDSVTDTNSHKYIYSEDECNQIGLQIWSDNKDDVINFFCNTYSENGVFLGYKIDINCKSENCSKYEYEYWNK